MIHAVQIQEEKAVNTLLVHSLSLSLTSFLLHSGYIMLGSTLEAGFVGGLASIAMYPLL